MSAFADTAELAIVRARAVTEPVPGSEDDTQQIPKITLDTPRPAGAGADAAETRALPTVDPAAHAETRALPVADPGAARLDGAADPADAQSLADDLLGPWLGGGSADGARPRRRRRRRRRRRAGDLRAQAQPLAAEQVVAAGYRRSGAACPVGRKAEDRAAPQGTTAVRKARHRG
ncbi:hypothetical protein ACU686_02745 [Yinghuangia aomiensis]